MADQNDLFGAQGAPVQESLFGVAEDRIPAPSQSFAPDPDKVRRRLAALLDQACQAKAMPWSERDARMWQTVFPQMANWLPDAEANQMRLEFSREMDRLRAA